LCFCSDFCFLFFWKWCCSHGEEYVAEAKLIAWKVQITQEAFLCLVNLWS
jgi:hypothetical protein